MQMSFFLPCVQGVHTAQLSIRLPWGHVTLFHAIIRVQSPHLATLARESLFVPLRLEV